MELDKPYNFKLTGRAKHVFAMIELLAWTYRMETDPEWWLVRAWRLASDRASDDDFRCLEIKLYDRRN